MKTSVISIIQYKAISFIISISRDLIIILIFHRKIIIIDKIIASIVRRIDIDHLDLTEIGLTQNLQNLKVISLDVKILCIIEIDTFLPAGTECHRSRRICKTFGF